MFDKAIKLIKNASKILVIQAENPDGDSLGSSLALEEILSDLGKSVSIHCPVEIPKYLRYVSGWDRVDLDFDYQADLAIIVDTTADILLSKTLEIPAARNFLETHPVLAIDHHISKSNLSFKCELVIEPACASGQVVYHLAKTAGWKINQQAAEDMMIAIMSDSLGLTTQNVAPETYFTVGELAKLGASNSQIEEKRREFMKKAPEILRYKGELIERIEYYLDGKLAMVYIPWEDIQKYSDRYNPSVLVLDEMRMVTGVEVAVAIKTYPDGKLTGKIRSNSPVSATLAGFFGGGGHEYAAGFRIYEEYDKAIKEVIDTTDKVLKEQKS